MAGFRVRSFCAAIFVALPLAALAEEATPTGEPEDAQESEDSEDPGELDDIENLVITARRRPEFLQETPVATTVLGGELLEQRGVDSLEEIGAYVPNLSSFSGVTHQGTFYSRGVGQRDAIVTLDPGVGIYVDDVYV